MSPMWREGVWCEVTCPQCWSQTPRSERFHALPVPLSLWFTFHLPLILFRMHVSFSGDLLYLLLHHSLGQIDRFPLFPPALTWKDTWACLHGSPFVLPLSFGLGIFSIISFLWGFYFFSSFLRFSPCFSLCYFWHLILVSLKGILHYLVTLPRVALFLLELLNLVSFQPAVAHVPCTCSQTKIPFKPIFLPIESTFAATKY